MPSLFSFLPMENPGKPRSTRNPVIPLYPLEGSALAKTMKSPASAPLVIQNFRPVSDQSLPFFSARVARAKASLPLPGSDRANAPEQLGGEPGEVARLLFTAGPANKGVVDQGVVHIDVDGGRGVHPGQLLDGNGGHEDAATAPAERLRHLDSHQSQLEELGNQVGPELRRLVHGLYMGTDLGLRELADGVAKHRLFLGQDRQGGRGDGQRGHGMVRVRGHDSQSR